jgi:hypothetical protein
MVATISHFLLPDLKANDPSLSDKVPLLVLVSRAFSAICDACLGLLSWQPISASKPESFELEVSFISKLKSASLKPLISIPRLIVILAILFYFVDLFHSTCGVIVELKAWQGPLVLDEALLGPKPWNHISGHHRWGITKHLVCTCYIFYYAHKVETHNNKIQPFNIS